MGLLPPPTEREVDALVRGYADEQLRENFSHAAEHPGTDWHVMLLAELRRRGLSTATIPNRQETP